MKRLPVLATAALGIVPCGAAAAPPPLASSPGAYIARYTQGIDCPRYTGRVWSSWQTYAAVSVGDQWETSASVRSLCGLARTAGRALTRRTRGRFGSGLSRPVLEDWALRSADVPLAIPRSAGVPAGWTCFAAPSQRGTSAAALAPGDPLRALPAASGLATSFGYCVKGARRAGGRWTGGSWVTFGPDIEACDDLFRLRTPPDPATPGAVLTPAYDQVALPAGYDRVPCP